MKKLIVLVIMALIIGVALGAILDEFVSNSHPVQDTPIHRQSIPFVIQNNGGAQLVSVHTTCFGEFSKEKEECAYCKVAVECYEDSSGTRHPRASQSKAQQDTLKTPVQSREVDEVRRS